MRNWLIVGLFNTFVGLSIIIFLTAVTANPVLSHTLGYIISAALGITLHAVYSFSNGDRKRALLFSIIAFFFAWTISVLFLESMLAVDFEQYLAQVISGGIYIIVHFAFFLCSRAPKGLLKN